MMLNETVLREHGIDIEEGLLYCAEDPEFYEEMLREYVIEGHEKTGELQDLFTAEEWKEYAIRAHSLKNTSKMIGAEGLSERARTLEHAAKEGDRSVLCQTHPVFLAEYQSLLKALSEMLG